MNSFMISLGGMYSWSHIGETLTEQKIGKMS